MYDYAQTCNFVLFCYVQRNRQLPGLKMKTTAEPRYYGQGWMGRKKLAVLTGYLYKGRFTLHNFCLKLSHAICLQHSYDNLGLLWLI
jgi:hypothetical protein